MGCLVVLLGPFSPFLAKNPLLGVVQLIGFAIACAVAGGLWWLWWVSCGIWTLAVAGSHAQEAQAERQRAIIEAQREKIEELREPGRATGIRRPWARTSSGTPDRCNSGTGMQRPRP